MNDHSKQPLNASKLHQALIRHAAISGKKLQHRHPHAVQFLHEKGIIPGKIREHAAKIITSGAIAGTLMLASPAMQHQPRASIQELADLPTRQREQLVSFELAKLLPHDVSLLTVEQEKKISALMKQVWGIDAKAELEGERLNRSYGLIGAEQHLPRFPGDTIEQHDAFQNEGITPGLGAWGYFAYSKDQLTEDLIQKEKWYCVAQTLYLPDWNTRTAFLSKWYKYRKVLMINPANGKTIVCDIADSGPADWTGKHYGGSPEVMAYLGLNVGMQKGPIVFFFVDDPENKIPLGPVEGRMNN